MYQAVITSPIGKLGISVTSEHLRRIEFLSDSAAKLKPTILLAKKVVEQLDHYFEDPSFVFDIDFPIITKSEFQTRVLAEMYKIPVGKTRCYGDLAKALKTSARAIGMACRHNPVPIIFPCHRIVAKDHLGGFNGKTEGKMMRIKEWLLNHEETFAL